MSHRIGKHLRSNVVGYIALFIALTIAPAWAATLAPDSVRSKHIKDTQVREADLDTNAVTTEKIASGQVQGDDIQNASVTAAKISDGNVGIAEIDNSTVQARITPGCPAGEAIQSVSLVGAVTCIDVEPAR